MPKTYCKQIDFLRAVLIMLVILVHIVSFGNMYPDVKADILSFIMPTFLIITGYLVNVNKTVKEFSLYITRLALPYVIMVTGYAVASLYLPVRDGITRLDAATMYRVICVTSIGQYWFIHTMIVCGMLNYISFRVARRYSSAARLSVFAFVLLLVAQYTPFLAINSAAYYFIGVAIRQYCSDITQCFKGSFWTAIPFSFIVTKAAFHDWGMLSVLCASICFISFIFKLSEYVEGEAQAVALYVGRNTLPIYLFHTIFTMAAKLFLPLFKFDGTQFLFTFFTIIFCLAGSLMIGKCMDKTHLSLVFGKRYIMR